MAKTMTWRGEVGIVLESDLRGTPNAIDADIDAARAAKGWSAREQNA